MRRPKNQGAADEFGRCLTALREAADNPSYDRIAKDFDKLGIDVTSDSIGRAHAGMTDPSQVSAEMLLGLIRYYEVEPSKLGFVAASRLRTLFTLAGDAGGPDGGGDQRSAQSRCTAQSSPGELAIVVPFRWSQPQLHEVA
jgi:hypothetical protein